MDRRVQQVIHRIKESFHREVSLAEIARSVNLSTSRLRHLFKAEIGAPPSQYLRALRMQHAKDLLENTFLSVKEIMIRVGFNDESHFVRDYKRTYGLPPIQYRRRHSSSGQAIQPMDSQIGQ